MMGPHTQDAIIQSWRASLLRSTLRFTGLAAIVASSVSVWATSLGPRATLPYFAVGALLLFLSLFVTRLPRAIGTAYIVLGVVIMGWQLYSAAWSPAVVSVLCVTLVFATVLVGRAAAIFVLVATAAMFVAGGVATMRYGFAPAFAEFVDPTSAGNWLHNGVVWAIVVGGGALVLRSGVQALAGQGRRVAGVVAALEAEVSLADAADATRREVEAAIGRAQKLGTLAQLGRGFAHVFNNILTVLRSSLDEADVAESQAERHAALDAVHQAIATSVDRTQDILGLARVGPGAVDELALDDWLIAVGPAMGRRLMSHVEVVLAPGSGAVVRCAPSALEQVLLNLLLNAEQATPQGGALRVSTHRQRFAEVYQTTIEPLEPGDYAVLRVSDPGAGMTAETAARAFEPFFTTRGLDTHDGLGLTVAHHLVRRAGGSAEVLRTEGGTTLAFYLPVASNASQPAPPESEQLHGLNPDLTREAALEERFRASALRRMIRVNAIAQLLLVALVVPFVGSSAVKLALPAILGPAAGVMVFAGWFRPRWDSRRLAVFLVVATLAVGGLAVIRFSYLAPVPVAYMTYSVVLAGLYLRPRSFALVLGLGLAVFMVGFYLYDQGLVVPPIADITGTTLRNWLRAGLATVVLASLVASAAAQLPLAMARRVGELIAAEASLQEVRRRRQQAIAASVDLEAMTRRAESMAASGRIIATVAHDINNSLQAVVLAEELLNDNPDDRETANFALGEIGRAADYIEALVNQLEVGGIGSGASQLLGGQADLSTEIPAMTHMLAALLRDSGELEIMLPDPGRPLGIPLPPQRLRQILLNLVANARDAFRASAGDGVCRVWASRDGSDVSLTVEDNGIGMAPDVAARVFEAFYTTKAKGTGLGLHSVAALVQAAGGKISVDSVPGEGTRVCIRLPWVPRHKPTPTSSPSDRPAATLGTRLLLVDDDPQVRRMLAVGLTRAGFEVVEAADGDEALDAMTSSAPLSALCTDAVMPGAPVARVVAGFRALYPGRPIVVISGYLPEEVRRRLDDSSVTILQKPFTGAALAAAIGEGAIG